MTPGQGLEVESHKYVCGFANLSTWKALETYKLEKTTQVTDCTFEFERFRNNKTNQLQKVREKLSIDNSKP